MTRPLIPFDVCRCHGVSTALGEVCRRRDNCLRYFDLFPAARPETTDKEAA